MYIFKQFTCVYTHKTTGIPMFALGFIPNPMNFLILLTRTDKYICKERFSSYIKTQEETHLGIYRSSFYKKKGIERGIEML